jgi:hypothetical protein
VPWANRSTASIWTPSDQRAAADLLEGNPRSEVVGQRSGGYDAGALIAAERGDRRVWALQRRAIERGIVPTVPAGVLSQGWRGGPQAQLSRLLAGCRIEHLDEARARSAGAACGVAGTADVVDAAVVVGAGARGDLVVPAMAATTDASETPSESRSDSNSSDIGWSTRQVRSSEGR